VVRYILKPTVDGEKIKNNKKGEIMETILIIGIIGFIVVCVGVAAAKNAVGTKNAKVKYGADPKTTAEFFGQMKLLLPDIENRLSEWVESKENGTKSQVANIQQGAGTGVAGFGPTGFLAALVTITPIIDLGGMVTGYSKPQFGLTGVDILPLLDTYIAKMKYFNSNLKQTASAEDVKMANDIDHGVRIALASAKAMQRKSQKTLAIQIAQASVKSTTAQVQAIVSIIAISTVVSLVVYNAAVSSVSAGNSSGSSGNEWLFRCPRCGAGSNTGGTCGSCSN
jgi:hypothetical protein